jgi:hypothetical protein
MSRRQRTTPTHLRAIERRTIILRERLAGKRFQDIAAERGWKAEYVRKDFAKWLKTQQMEAVEEYRKVQLDRFERLLNSYWDKAIAGEDRAALVCLRVLDQISKLLGLDAPTKTQIEGGGVITIVYSGDDWARGTINAEAEVVPELPPPNGNGNGEGHE